MEGIECWDQGPKELFSIWIRLIWDIAGVMFGQLSQAPTQILINLAQVSSSLGAQPAQGQSAAL